MLSVSLFFTLFISSTLLTIQTTESASSQQQQQHHYHHKHQPPNNQHASNSALAAASATTTTTTTSKQLTSSKLIKHPVQQALIEQNPGTLMAVARALKMAKVECQYQMRHEPWDCPIFELDIKPVNMFGKLMTRSFRETSFIHSLLSAALAHSVTRACTESMIKTCSRGISRDNGFKENIEFGVEFARKFMDATHELSTLQTHNNIIDTNSIAGSPQAAASLPSSSSSSSSSSSLATSSATATTTTTTTTAAAATTTSTSTTNGHSRPSRHSIISSSRSRQSRNIIDHNNTTNGNSYATSMGGNGAATAAAGGSSGRIVGGDYSYSTTIQPVDSNRREQKLRLMINAHNDEAGFLHVIHSVKRVCKCHGLSGSCNMETCWLRLSPFREIATKLHQNLEQAIKIVYSPSQYPSIYRTKPLLTSSSSGSSSTSWTDSSIKKSNKKRSSHHQPPLSPINSIVSSASVNVPMINKRSSSSSSSKSFGSSLSPAATSESASAAAIATTTISPFTAYNMIDTNGINIRGHSINNMTNNVVKKRPVARSIGLELSMRVPNKDDLLYRESSPDFCEPNEVYNIKGTKGRNCSEDRLAANSCERLCCGRGYKTEVRDEKYNCECEFKFCCQLNCKKCIRRKITHKCL